MSGKNKTDKEARKLARSLIKVLSDSSYNKKKRASVFTSACSFMGISDIKFTVTDEGDVTAVGRDLDAYDVFANGVYANRILNKLIKKLERIPQESKNLRIEVAKYALLEIRSEFAKNPRDTAF